MRDVPCRSDNGCVQPQRDGLIMTTSQIVFRFAEIGHEIDETDVISRMDVLVNQFKVPVEEAEKSVVSYFLRKLGVERSEYYTGSGGNQMVAIADLPQQDGKWCNIRAKVVDVWETTSEHMSQTGLIGDETGRTKFVIWKNAELPDMIDGKSYMIDNVVTNLYNDRVSITFNKTSTITEIDEDIEVGDTISEYTGALVSIKNGSGLIKRCPECNRAIIGGACTEHGNVDGDYDIRIMAILDDGTSTQDILLNREIVECVWGYSLEDAIQMAVDNLDAGVVIDNMRTELLGKYYTVQGSLADTMLLVNEFEAI